MQSTLCSAVPLVAPAVNVMITDEQGCKSAGPALSLLPLILFRERTPMSLAVCCLAAFMGLQAFCYAGFHAYVQVRLTSHIAPDTAAAAMCAPTS